MIHTQVGDIGSNKQGAIEVTIAKALRCNREGKSGMFEAFAA